MRYNFFVDLKVLYSFFTNKSIKIFLKYEYYIKL
nr:MAG TPA: hypothetical protein [Caudoviricetes sp.]